MSHRERLEDLGVPPDAVDSLVDERLAQALQPLFGAAGAVQEMQRSPHGDRVVRHLEQNPQLAERVMSIAAVNPTAGAEMAILAYENASGHAPRPTSSSGTTFIGMPGMPAAQAGAPPWAAATMDVDTARERLQRTGSRQDAVAFARARLAGTIEQQFRQAGQDLNGQPW